MRKWTKKAQNVHFKEIQKTALSQLMKFFRKLTVILGTKKPAINAG